jgi:hypothetical protein
MTNTTSKNQDRSSPNWHHIWIDKTKAACATAKLTKYTSAGFIDFTNY